MASVRLLLAFAEAARHRSFARAARDLGLTPSGVAKSVSRLEQQLGLRLFHRSTRQINLTQEGQELYERCRRILDQLGELELQAAAASRSPTGTLRLSAPVEYGKRVLLPILAQLMRQHPTLSFELRLSDAYADIIGEGLDAAVRVGELRDSRLVARVFDRQYLGVYAAPDYLRQKGRPDAPGRLDRHDCIAFRQPNTGRERPWSFRIDGRTASLQPPAKYALDDADGVLRAAIAGLGLAQVPDHVAAPAVAAGQLEEVLIEYRPEAMPVAIVFPTHRYVPLRLRVLVDALSAARTPPAGAAQPRKSPHPGRPRRLRASRQPA